MTDTDTETYANTMAGREALYALREMLMNEKASDASRVSAARALLDRYAPKENAEAKRREEDERNAAIAEAKCILAELAAAKSGGDGQPVALVESRAPEPDHADPE